MLTVRKFMIMNALDAAELDESALHTNYSGRGMYGDTCFGVVGNVRTYGRFLIALMESDAYDAELLAAERLELATELASRVRTDGMGLDTIFYFPGIQLTDE
jgi:hypothetical protein